MNAYTDKLWMGYIDQEFTTLENTTFEENLENKDKKRLIEENKFEISLSKKISDISCSNELWENIKRQIQDEEVSQSKKYHHIMPKIIAIAALIALTIVLFFNYKNTTTPSANFASFDKYLNIPADVATLKASSQVLGDESKIKQFLKNEDVNINLLTPSKEGHKVVLLGASKSIYNNEKIITVNYSCCGEPLKIIIAKIKSSSAKLLLNAINTKKVQKIKNIGNYQIGIVGKHPGDKILNLFTTT